MSERIPLLDRLLRHVEEDENGCWVWTSSLDKDGYGKWTIARVPGDWSSGRRHVRPHRIAYEILVGAIESETLDHLCRNRACCNPDHLEPASNRENIMRGFGAAALNARKTTCAHGHSLTEESTYVYVGTNGREWRSCRECQRRLGREWKREKRARDAA